MLTLKLNTYYYNIITFAGNKTNSDNKYNTKQNLQDFKYEAYAVCYLLLQDTTVQPTNILKQSFNCNFSLILIFTF